MSPASKTPRWAIAHDWLTGMRGGEKVLRRLCRLLPEAPIYTLVHVPGACTGDIERRRIHAGELSDLPGIGRMYRRLLPLMPPAAERLDLGDCDVVVSSSHCVAKGFGVKRHGQLHVCYCHTPMRYAWRPGEYGRGPAGLALRALGPFLRAWDRRTAGRVDLMLANSACVARRIRQAYGLPSIVLYPPVDTDFFTPADVEREDFYLLVSAAVPYKRVDLALDAAAASGRHLRVIGTGPELPRLRRRAPAGAELLGRCSDETLRDAYRRCRAVLLPQVEDCGLVPLEAMACGTPVIALAAGGALETVLDVETAPAGEATGLLFRPQTADALADAIERFEQVRRAFRPRRLRAWAEAFSHRRFDEGFVRAVSSALLRRGFALPAGWEAIMERGRTRPC